MTPEKSPEKNPVSSDAISDVDRYEAIKQKMTQREALDIHDIDFFNDFETQQGVHGVQENETSHILNTPHIQKKEKFEISTTSTIEQPVYKKKTLEDLGSMVRDGEIDLVSEQRNLKNIREDKNRTHKPSSNQQSLGHVTNKKQAVSHSKQVFKNKKSQSPLEQYKKFGPFSTLAQDLDEIEDNQKYKTVTGKHGDLFIAENSEGVDFYRRYPKTEKKRKFFLKKHVDVDGKTTHYRQDGTGKVTQVDYPSGFQLRSTLEKTFPYQEYREQHNIGTQQIDKISQEMVSHAIPERMLSDDQKEQAGHYRSFVELEDTAKKQFQILQSMKQGTRKYEQEKRKLEQLQTQVRDFERDHGEDMATHLYQEMNHVKKYDNERFEEIKKNWNDMTAANQRTEREAQQEAIRHAQLDEIRYHYQDAQREYDWLTKKNKGFASAGMISRADRKLARAKAEYIKLGGKPEELSSATSFKPTEKPLSYYTPEQVLKREQNTRNEGVPVDSPEQKRYADELKKTYEDARDTNKERNKKIAGWWRRAGLFGALFLTPLTLNKETQGSTDSTIDGMPTEKVIGVPEQKSKVNAETYRAFEQPAMFDTVQSFSEKKQLGDGYTQIIERILKRESAVRDAMGITMEDINPAFMKQIGQEFGYIDSQGNEVRLETESINGELELLLGENGEITIRSTPNKEQEASGIPTTRRIKGSGFEVMDGEYASTQDGIRLHTEK